jgi:UDP-N-acetylmuramate--alanine ligase
MQIPWSHILYDAYIAYIIGHMMWINDRDIVDALEDYTGIWRRMESIGTTQGWNLLMSDYWHHPTEISLTLWALKEKYPNKHIFTIFQPHQYSRTLELLDDFKDCFYNTDTLVIPDIYESRDSESDKRKMNSKILSDSIHHPNVVDWIWLKNSLQLLEKFDSNNTNSFLFLLGAGNIDELRYDIKVK